MIILGKKKKTELGSRKSNYTTVIVRGKKTKATLLSRIRYVFKLPQLNKLPSSLKFMQKHVTPRL